MIIQPIHGCNVIAMLDKEDLDIDTFRTYFGNELETAKAGNGDTWYNIDQVHEFISLYEHD